VKAAKNTSEVVMNYDFPSDVAQQVQQFIATGQFADEDDVLRGALTALSHQQDDIEAIRLAIRQIEAGEGRTLEEFDAEFRAEHGIPLDS
jgi:Arc/MetJ-type ribon-helix-helix transcriptional regulator